MEILEGHITHPGGSQVGKVTVEVAQNVAKNETVQASVKGIQSTIEGITLQSANKQGASRSGGNMAEDIETGTAPTPGKKKTRKERGSNTPEV